MTDLLPTEVAMNALFDLPAECFGRLRYTLEEDPGSYKKARETDLRLLQHLQGLLPNITDNIPEVGRALAKYVTHFRTLEGVQAVHKELARAFPTGDIFRLVDMRASTLMTQYEEDWIATFGHHPLVAEAPKTAVSTNTPVPRPS